MSFKLLGDIVKIKGGKRLPKSSQLQVIKNDHPYIRVRDMGERYLPRSGLEYVPDNIFPSISRYIVNTNDLILSIVGTVGLVSIVDEFFNNASLTENCVKLTGLDEKDAKYLYYYLLSQYGKEEIKARTIGAVQLKLPLYNIEKIQIRWFDKLIREKIVNCLSTLDDKIELNNQTNQNLENIAQAIFKSWFVDFEPVRAKMAAKQEGNDSELAAMCAISGKSEAELEQMAKEDFAELQATAALFPDELVESELGEVPKGWDKYSLSKMITLIGGGTPKRSEPDYWNGNIYWFSVKDVPKESDTFVIRTEERITELGLNKSSTKLLPVGTTIITARGTVGKIALVGHEMAMNQSCYGVQGINGVKQFMTYYLIKNAVEVLKKNTHGAVFDTITQATFETVVSIKPDIQILNLFECKVEKIMDQIKNNLYQNHSLIEIRDTLLPKLLSGELDVSGLQGEGA